MGQILRTLSPQLVNKDTLKCSFDNFITTITHKRLVTKDLTIEAITGPAVLITDTNKSIPINSNNKVFCLDKSVIYVMWGTYMAKFNTLRSDTAGFWKILPVCFWGAIHCSIWWLKASLSLTRSTSGLNQTF